MTALLGVTGSYRYPECADHVMVWRIMTALLAGGGRLPVEFEREYDASRMAVVISGIAESAS